MALNHVELTKLIAAARAGDIEAFTQIVRRHQNMALATAYGMLGDFHLAQDAVQEAFLAAYSGLSSIQDDSAFPGWLRTTVRHYCHRILRKRQIVEVALEEDVPLPARERPDEDMVRNDQRRIILNAVAGIPPAEREVIALFYLQEYPQREIARFLNLPLTTVNFRLHSARQKLKRRINHMLRDTLQESALPDDFAERIGEILRVQGPLVDVKITLGSMPELLSTLVVGSPGDAELTIEVVQHAAGAAEVRCIATASTALLRPGLKVSTPKATAAYATQVEAVVRAVIFPTPPTELLETGIKVLDLLCPLGRHGAVGLFGPSGAGKLGLLEELLHNLAELAGEVTFFTFVRSEETESLRASYRREPHSLERARGSQAFFLRSEGVAPGALDTVVRLSPEIAASRRFPAIDPHASTSRLLVPEIAGREHCEIAARVRELLLANPTHPRARKLEWFFTQPFHSAELYSKIPGQRVNLAETLRVCRAILEGAFDNLPDEAFRYIGGFLP